MNATESDLPPHIHVRWYQVGVPELLSVIPITLSATVTWRPLTRTESDACEKAWLKLPILPKVDVGEEAKEAAQEIENTTPELATEPTEDDEDDAEDWIGVPIEREQLFEVDVRIMKLRPVYWKSSGPQIPVMRAIWHYDPSRPVEGDLAARLEEAYLAVKPWQSFYQDELRVAHEIGGEALDRLKYPLEGTSYQVVFDDACTAQLLTTSVSRRLSSIFSTARAKAGSIAMVYRGYDEAVAHSNVNDADPVPVVPTGDGIRAPEGSQQIPSSPRSSAAKSAQRSSTELIPETTQEVTDLVLVVHGIGQGLTASYEAFNFVYATNLLRNVARKQALSPALSSILRSKHVQFLPVQWRASMKFDLDSSRTDGDEDDESEENHYTLSDITPKGAIPYVRELTNNVLTDIPLYMSHHRRRMTESVCYQANRTYRLWCARNPNFEKHGRVHIIAHSLGTALVTHILSNQPTRAPPLSSLSDQEKKGTLQHFLFDTSTLFMLGSPVSIFLRIQEAPLVARKNRERTMDSPPDEAFDEVGKFGCLAVDSIYNIFNPADPIAYLLNPCVDSRRAKRLSPFSIPSVIPPVLAPLTTRIGKVFDGLVSSSKPSRSQSRRDSLSSEMMTTNEFEFSSSPAKKSNVPALHRTATEGGFELSGSGGDKHTLVGKTRAERRFQALNPHGTLDYVLPSEGKFSEYVDMITAHSSYWADPNLAAFVLAELFGRKTDLLRTGLGAESAIED